MNKRLVLHLIVYSMFLCLLASCTRAYYVADDGNLLMLQEKGDLKLAGGFGFSELKAQVGISPIKHLAISGYYFSSDRNKLASGTNVFKIRRYSGNIGCYYFLPSKVDKKNLLKSDRERGFLFDIYAGYSQGEIDNFYATNGSSHLAYQKYYIQPGIHAQGATLSISYNMKIGRLNYFKGVGLRDVPAEHILQLQDLEERNPFNLLEHSIKIQAGVRSFTFFANVSISDILEEYNFTQVNSQISVGVILDVDEFYKKKKKSKL